MLVYKIFMVNVGDGGGLMNWPMVGKVGLLKWWIKPRGGRFKSVRTPCLNFIRISCGLFFTTSAPRIPGKSRQVWAWLCMPAYTYPKVLPLAYYLFLVNIPMQKIKDTDELLPEEIVTINESCNLIGKEHFRL